MTANRIKLADILCNREFDVNCNYKVYYGTWDDSGELLWDSTTQGRIDEDNDIASYTVSYITVNNNYLIVEVN